MKRFVMPILLVCFAEVAFAASQGSLGATSQAQAQVNLNIPAKIKVDGIADITKTWANGAETFSVNYCVWRNGGGAYTAELTTDRSAFELYSTTTTESITYTVKIDQDADASNGDSILYGATSNSLSASSDPNCGGTESGSVEVSVPVNNINGATPASDYNSVITVTVTPV